MSALSLVARIFAHELDSVLLGALMSGPMADHFFPPGEREQLVASVEGETAADKILLALEIEYCRLFIQPNAPCAPYVAAIRKEPVLGGRAAKVLGAALEAHGFELAAPLYGDHIASYLEFAAELSPEERLRFLAPHRDWLSTYFSRVAASTTTTLYRESAMLAQACLEACVQIDSRDVAGEAIS